MRRRRPPMPGTTKTAPEAAPACRPPGGRSPITPEQAAELTGVFKVLANDTRLRLLHALVCAGDLCVTDLGEALGLSPPAVSNQLQRLPARRIVASRRQGHHVYYRIVNPCVTDLLDRGLSLARDGGTES